MKKVLITAVAGSVLILGAVHPVSAGGGRQRTPFSTSATISCEGVISWSATVGTQSTQAVWVKADSLSIAMQQAPLAGTYRGVARGYNPAVAHTLVLRRVVEAKVEETVIRTTGQCV